MIFFLSVIPTYYAISQQKTNFTFVSFYLMLWGPLTKKYTFSCTWCVYYALSRTLLISLRPPSLYIFYANLLTLRPSSLLYATLLWNLIGPKTTRQAHVHKITNGRVFLYGSWVLPDSLLMVAWTQYQPTQYRYTVINTTINSFYLMLWGPLRVVLSPASPLLGARPCTANAEKISFLVVIFKGTVQRDGCYIFLYIIR